MKQVFDPIRRVWVAATPEELVRQQWIMRLIDDLHFPKELLAVEKELQSLSNSKTPSRRIDLLSFMKQDSTLSPLLLIECKEGNLTQRALNQAIGYNYYVNAPYVALVNQEQARFISILSPSYREITYIPSYDQLTERKRG